MKKVENTCMIKYIHHTEPAYEVEIFEFSYNLLNSVGYIVVFSPKGLIALVKIK